ncbi:hypothetical protein LNO81_14580 [Klebsiella variicola subsp. variicola]|nr:hypothetical protein [Klebsiella variicola subsp. variicola]
MKAQNIHLSIVTVGAYVTPGSAEAREIADLFLAAIPPAIRAMDSGSILSRPTPSVTFPGRRLASGEPSPGRAEETSSIACFPCHLGSGYDDIHGGCVMKYSIGMAVTLLLSTPVLAAGELEINQSP